MIQFLAPVSHVQDRRDLAAFYLNLSRTGGAVVPYRVGERPAFLINRPELARYVLVTNQHNYHNPYHPYAELADQYRPEGRFLLGLCQGMRAQASLSRGMTDVFVRITEKTVEDLIRLSAMNLVSVDLATKHMLFRAITRVLFGVDPDHMGTAFVRAVGLIEECAANQRGVDAADPVLRDYQAAIRVQNGAAAWIAYRSNMVPKGQRIPDRVITAIVRTLLNSYNATATGLCWVLYQVARYPAILDRLYEEVDRVVGSRRVTLGDLPNLHFSRLVVMETLRLYPPAWSIGREVIAPDWVGDVLLPPGALVSVSAYTMQRLACVWERPGEFVPERFMNAAMRKQPPFAFFPFGGGARRCPAGNRSISHIQLMLTTILQRCRLSAVEQPDVRPRGLIALRPHPGVWMRFYAR